MSSQAVAPLPVRNLESWQSIQNQINGTVKIISTGGIPGLTGEGSGWAAQGSVITFAPVDNAFYVLTLEPPTDWTWNPSASLEIFHGEANLCGFYSNQTVIMAFNGTENQAPQVLRAIFNLQNENGLPAPFTVFLHFPAGTVQPDEEESPAQAMPIPAPSQQSIECTAIVDGNNHVTGVQVEGSGRGWSTSNPTGEGQITLQPVSDPVSTVTTWNLGLDFPENGWHLASSPTFDSPTFEVYFENERACGVVFMGPRMKVYNFLPPGGAQQTFTLGLRLTNEDGQDTQWVDDPTVLFDPPDPPV